MGNSFDSTRDFVVVTSYITLRNTMFGILLTMVNDVHIRYLAQPHPCYMSYCTLRLRKDQAVYRQLYITFVSLCSCLN